jgi:hypothetical protein
MFLRPFSVYYSSSRTLVVIIVVVILSAEIDVIIIEFSLNLY